LALSSCAGLSKIPPRCDEGADGLRPINPHMITAEQEEAARRERTDNAVVRFIKAGRKP
jgi:hypothetical protein